MKDQGSWRPAQRLHAATYNKELHKYSSAETGERPRQARPPKFLYVTKLPFSCCNNEVLQLKSGINDECNDYFFITHAAVAQIHRLLTAHRMHVALTTAVPADECLIASRSITNNTYLYM
jgi:hypothetical protein